MEGNNNNPHVDHERKDINFRALTKFGIAFVLAGIVMHFFLWFVFDYFRGREAPAMRRPSIAVGMDARQLPPEPRLQAAPIRDLMEMRTAEKEILEGYSMLDEARGVVRIPVSRAMELLAAEAVPGSAPAATRPPAQVTVPSRSGLGPIMTQAGGPLSPNRVFPPDQPLEIRGGGDARFGRQAGGRPTPPEYSLGEVVNGVTPPRGAGGATVEGQSR
ncbi:MAG TPA: hypothetical protein VN442_06450 [Bryobacteraceae bacterium]|nr:hypothetical protein [Bryobacteraceae bacterium]